MNNNRVLIFLLNMLQVFMQMCVAVCLTNLLLHGFMGFETFQVWNTLYIGVVIFVFYLAKTCVKNGKLSTAIHLLAVSSIFFMVKGSLEEQMMVVIPALIFFSYSMKRKNEQPFFPLDIGILFGCYVAGFTIKAESGTVIPFYCSMIYVIAFFIWYNIRNLNTFVSENGRVKSFNAEQAVNVNSVMLAIFMLVCTAVMFIMPRLHLQDIIKAVLLGIWRLALAGFHALNIPMPEGGYELEQALIEKEQEEGSDFGIGLEMTEGNDILDLIMVIFAAVIFVCMMVLVLKALKDLRYKKSQGNDVKEFVKPALRKEKNTPLKKKEKFFFHAPNDIAVRKLYKGLILNNAKKGQKVDKTDTPSEISKSVIGWSESTREITDIYEKARYSEEKIAKEEVEMLQKARRNFK